MRDFSHKVAWCCNEIPSLMTLYRGRHTLTVFRTQLQIGRQLNGFYCALQGPRY